MIKKRYYSWTDVENMCTSIVNDMYNDCWRPDYIVGITRGGNVPATIISNMTGIRCEAIKVSLRDNESGRAGDSVNWMADDAFGVLDGKIASGSPTSKKILIVDDQLYNVNAMMIILQYAIKIDIEKVCEKATSGKQAIDLIK